MFKLEILKAKKGDCLLLHHGDPTAPALILVDGGPPGVYPSFLEPRLAELSGERGGQGTPLPLELVMISHVAQDHISGVLSLLRAIEHARDASDPEPYEVGHLWHNGFKTLADADDASVAKAAKTERPRRDTAAVIASIGEGSDTSVVASHLGIPRNEPSELGDLVLAGAERTLSDGLRMTVLGPRKQRVEDLREQWANEVGVDPEQLVPAAVQETVTNLSSLIVLAELDGKRVLLTGDARSTDIEAGLDDAELLDDQDSVHLDVLKMPHHGSKENVSEPADFLERVTADHYVLSGNGQHGNPELETLQAVAAARAGDEYDLWLTYREGNGTLAGDLKTFEGELRAAGSPARLHFPADDEASMSIELS